MQSSMEVGDGLRRARTAFRTVLARPSTLVKVAGFTGLFCFWLARRTRSQSSRPLNALWDVLAQSVPGLVLVNMLRRGRTRLRTVFR